MNRTYSSADLDTPRDNIDDISSTLNHTLDQDIVNVDNSSEFSLSIHTSAPHSNVGVKQNQGQLFVGNSSDVNESQSIDINAINLNNHMSLTIVNLRQARQLNNQTGQHTVQKTILTLIK